MTVNPLYSSQELARQLRISGATYLVTIPPLAESAKDAAASEGVRSVFVIGEAPGCESLSDVLSDDGTAFPEHVNINPKEDMVWLSFSFLCFFLYINVKLPKRAPNNSPYRYCLDIVKSLSELSSRMTSDILIVRWMRCH